MFDAQLLGLRPELAPLLQREWQRLERPGSFWTAAERGAVAAEARHERYGDPVEPHDLRAEAVEAARLLAARPAEARRGWVERMAGALGFPAYVELVGVVARLAAVDTLHIALGLPRPALPTPAPGEAGGALDSKARSGAAWVPMLGGASIAHALSLVPAEDAAQEDMHRLYLTYEEMGDITFTRGLTRTQMELVAGRTSALNECFY